MTNDADEKPDEFSRSAQQALENESRALDGATLSKLRQARERAVEKARNRASGGKTRMSWWLPAGISMTAVVLLTVLVSRNQPDDIALSADRNQLTVLENGSDWEILLSTEDVAFYESLDFLLWLDQQDHAS